MPIDLTNRDAQRLLGALKTIEASNEVKFSARTRLHIAVDINRLMPAVAAFESVSAKRRLDQSPTDSNGENRVIQRELIDLADERQSYDLAMIGIGELGLNENTGITGDQLASLAPVLEGLEEAAKAAA